MISVDVAVGTGVWVGVVFAFGIGLGKTMFMSGTAAALDESRIGRKLTVPKLKSFFES